MAFASTKSPQGARRAPQPKRRYVATWPTNAITVFVGLFCLVVGIAWTYGHLVRREPIDATAWIIAAATLLRVVSIGIALSSVRHWGRRLPQPLVATGLWGCAAAQLVYPVAELVVKVAVLAGWFDLPATGIGNMSATGWFNLSMAWLIFGVPGLLFVLAARSHANRRGASGPWPVVGLVAGTALLFAIGALIGG